MKHDMGAMHAGNGIFDWFAGHGYALHRGCFLDDDRWVAAYVAANWVIAIAYALVALLIYQRMRRASHIPRTLMGASLLGIFVTCSVGHLLAGVTTILWPGYRLEALWHWATVVPAWVFLAHHQKFSLIVEGPHTIAETREQLAARNRELNVAYDRIKHQDELKSQFFANVSHELRTPITLIAGLARRLQNADSNTPAQRRDLQTIERNSRTLQKHVDDLLDIARLEAGGMQLEYSRVDLVRLVQRVAANFEVAAAERDQKLVLSCPTTLFAECDEEKIERVIVNLLANALKFTPRGGTVRAELKAGTRVAVFTLDDSGPGIPSDMLKSIFERFRQVEAGHSRRYGGTGLGLAIVKELLSLHGGTVVATGSNLGGARFVVNLPIFAPQDVRVSHLPESVAQRSHAARQSVEELPAESTAPPPEDPRPASGPLVLIVEDNVEMSRFLQEALTATYQVVCAYNGDDGFRKACELRPDLIISDVMMPGVSGDTLLSSLRRVDELADVPIVVITAKADDELRVKMLREGAQDYIMKPFLIEEVDARVRNLMEFQRVRKALKNDLNDRSADLETAARELVQRRNELEAVNERLRLAIQEAHHRIKNNLQAVTALLSIEAEAAGDSLPKSAVEDSLSRIKAIAIVHDMLTHTAPIGAVDVRPVLQRLMSLLRTTMEPISAPDAVILSVESVRLPTKAATCLALIVNELVSNTLKHGLKAAEDRRPDEPVLEVSLSVAGDEAALSVRDAGIGFADDFDFEMAANVGLQLVASLVTIDLQGAITFSNMRESGDDRYRGARIDIVFPLSKQTEPLLQ